MEALDHFASETLPQAILISEEFNHSQKLSSLLLFWKQFDVLAEWAEFRKYFNLERISLLKYPLPDCSIHPKNNYFNLKRRAWDGMGGQGVPLDDRKKISPEFHYICRD